MNEEPLSEAVRQQALDRLTDAFANDAITLEDYERRAAIAQNARGRMQLLDAVAGLPRPAPLREPAGPPAAGSARAPRTRDEDRGYERRIETRPPGSATDTVACVMGDRHMTGDWLTGDAVTSFTLMGSTTLDLRDTPLPAGRLRIDAFTLMGEIKVIVPRGVPVRMNVFPFMGEAKLAAGVERKIDRDGPWVEVSGFAMMASVVVTAAD